VGEKSALKHDSRIPPGHFFLYINKTLEEGFKWGIWNREEYIEKVMYVEN